MRIAYLDCQSGVSGDMLLGALVDGGLELAQLQGEIDKLRIEGVHLEARAVSRNAVAGTQISVRLHGHEIEPTQEHHIDLASAADPAHHPIHHGDDIAALIGNSALEPHVRSRALKVFQRLTAAEARVHGTDPAHVHLHEVGTLDAVIDVVGAVAGLSLLGVQAVYASPLYMGTGFVECAHGRLPVPVPAVVALCQDVPCVQTDVQAELVTPTGAAILTTVAREFGTCPPFRLRKVGYGAGQRDLEAVPNVLRLRLGETTEEYEQDRIVVVETNIDDMNPEVFGYLTDELLSDGARDVTIAPVYMKKGRPGNLLTIQADEANLDRVITRVLTETTSIGVRYYYVQRRKLRRESAIAQTEFGSVRVKICEADGVRRVAPEYEDCARLARCRRVPILSVYAAARAAMTSGGPSC